MCFIVGYICVLENTFRSENQLNYAGVSFSDLYYRYKVRIMYFYYSEEHQKFNEVMWEINGSVANTKN